MAVHQPPYQEDHARASWEYEITSQLNELEGRSLSLLNTIDTKQQLAKLKYLLDNQLAIKERLETPLLFIQDEQPNPVHNNKGFMWIQTNVNESGDFSFWFCED